MSRVPRGSDVSGPLAPYATAYLRHLVALGYAESTAIRLARLLAQLSRWMDEQHVAVAELTLEHAHEFLRARRAIGYLSYVAPRSLTPLLDYLHGLDLMPAAVLSVSATPIDQTIDGYRAYLLAARGLTHATVDRYEGTTRAFLAEYTRDGVIHFDGMTSARTQQFVVRECVRLTTSSAKSMTTALRSLLRFLFAEGRTGTDLSAAVPTVPGWRGGFLPRGLGAQLVARLLASCDLGTAMGRRDYAMLILMSRLGLRAGEIAALRLGDIDWRAGHFVISGKAHREECLPLPTDVGRAVADYLRLGPSAHGDGGHVFLRVRGPVGGLTRSAVRAAVYHACDQIGAPKLGPHRLRHTAATEMLRGGGSLAEIAQVLRHRSHATTANYAKVDRRTPHLPLRRADPLLLGRS